MAAPLKLRREVLKDLIFELDKANSEIGGQGWKDIIGYLLVPARLINRFWLKSQLSETESKLIDEYDKEAKK